MELLLSLNGSSQYSAASGGAGGGARLAESSTPLVPATHAEMRAFIIAGTVSKILVYVSSCANPIIYGLMNRNYSR